jgi:hypothetical protein
LREIKIMSNGFKDFVGKVPRFDRKEIIWIDLLTPDGRFIFRFVFGACECVPSGESFKQTNSSACDDLASLRIINFTFEKKNLT